MDQFVVAIHVASDVDANINAQIHRLAAYARDTLMRASPHAVEDARRSLEEIRGAVRRAGEATGLLALSLRSLRRRSASGEAAVSTGQCPAVREVERLDRRADALFNFAG